MTFIICLLVAVYVAFWGLFFRTLHRFLNR